MKHHLGSVPDTRPAWGDRVRRLAALSLGACWLSLIAAGVAYMLPGWPGLAMDMAVLCLSTFGITAGLLAWKGHKATLRARARRMELRELMRNETGAVLVCRGERVVAANDAARALLPFGGMAGGRMEGCLLATVLPGWTTDRIPQTGNADAVVSGADRTVRLVLSRRATHLDQRGYAVVSLRGHGERSAGAPQVDGHFWDALAQRLAERQPGVFGLLLLELRRTGGTVEDALMRRVGAQLAAGPAGVRLATRFGRDRFALLVDERSPDRLRALGVSLAAVLTEWLGAEGGAPGVRAHAGVALASSDAQSPRALVDAAERALEREEEMCGGEACRAG